MTEIAHLNIINATAIARITDRGVPRAGSEQGELDILTDGAIAIRDGRIAAVGPVDQLRDELAEDVPTLDVRGGSVIPGLVECHSHPLFVGYRHQEFVRKIQGESSDQIKAAGGGIWASVMRCREASDEALIENAVQAYARIVKGGVTTLEVKSGYGLTTEQELRALRLLKESAARTPLDLVYTFLGAHIIPAEAESAQEYALLVLNEMLPAIAEQGIAGFHDVVCESDVFPYEMAAPLMAASEKYGFRTRVHADASLPSRGWATAVQAHAISADHLTYTPDDEIRSTGSTDTIAVLLPIAEQVYMDNRKANARLFIETGVPIAVATDYCSSIHATSLLATVQIAPSWYRITPGEALVGATLNAAYSLNRQSDRGSIDVGKRADLVILDCPHPDELGVAIGSPLIRQVLSAGRVIHSA